MSRRYTRKEPHPLYLAWQKMTQEERARLNRFLRNTQRDVLRQILEFPYSDYGSIGERLGKHRTAVNKDAGRLRSAFLRLGFDPEQLIWRVTPENAPDDDIAPLAETPKPMHPRDLEALIQNTGQILGREYAAILVSEHRKWCTANGYTPHI